MTGLVPHDVSQRDLDARTMLEAGESPPFESPRLDSQAVPQQPLKNHKVRQIDVAVPVEVEQFAAFA